jgi:ribonuclease/clavin/mitogillin
MSSLKTLLALKPSVLYPAHGPHITDREAVTRHLTEYITHRQQREDQLVKLLQDLAANPTTLRERMADLHEKVFQASVAEDKYNHEFFSGKPYHPKITEKDKDGKDVQISDEKLAKMREEERVERRAAVLAKYPLSSSSASMALICRLLYQSDKETLVNSAAKSIGAHLRKLESEGKVKKVKTRLPKVTEGQISEDLEDVDAWQWAGELGSGEAEAKPNTE